MTFSGPIRPNPQTIERSSPKARSPWISTKSLTKLEI